MKHDRDFLFTYAGLRQIVDKYLVQDRSNGKLYESPQYMYMLIAAVLFKEYSKEKRLQYVKKYYDAISQFKINIPTPIMAGIRTPLRQFASCVLVVCIFVCFGFGDVAPVIISTVTYSVSVSIIVVATTARGWLMAKLIFSSALPAKPLGK